MSERYVPGDLTRELVPHLYRLIDQLEAVAAKREAQYGRYGEIIDLGHADGLRVAAQRLRDIITDTERA